MGNFIHVKSVQVILYGTLSEGGWILKRELMLWTICAEGIMMSIIGLGINTLTVMIYGMYMGWKDLKMYEYEAETTF